MKFYIFLFLLVVTGLFGCKSQMQNSKSTFLSNKSKEVVDDFFNKVKTGNYNTALGNLLEKNTNIDLQDSATINLKNKFDYLNKSSGKFISFRLLLKKEIDNDFGVYSYLVKYDRKFYRFLFTFYNNESEVKIYKFSFDDTADLELEESLRLYSLPPQQ